MNDVEALMWRLEADPALSANFANLTILDRAPDHDRLRSRLWRASRVVPRLRRRVIDGGLGRTPFWEDDDDFDIDRHLRFRTLAPGADETDIRAEAVRIVAAPFDHSHPLWEFTVFEGLPDGRAAMVQKMHHTITDGVRGIRMSVEFIDLERDAPAPAPVDDGPPERASLHEPHHEATSPFAAAGNLVGTASRRGLEVAGSLVSSVAEVVRDPIHAGEALVGLPAETVETVRSLARQFAVLDGHRSPLWAARSTHRALETFEVPLEEVKQAGRRLGVSVNDLFVAAAAGGAGRYHRRFGVEADELRITMPVSSRSERPATGNAFTPTRVLVPTWADSRRRIAEIHRRLDVTKSERAIGHAAALAGLAVLVPQPVLVRLFRQQVATVDFATSNVRAAPFDLYIAGALVEANHPIGPLGGTAWNLTTMSYRGNLGLGLHVDTAAVTEPATLAADIADAFAELLGLR